MPSEIRVEVDQSTNNGAFTNYDIIQGRVLLVVTDSISLTSIQVKLEGVSKTELLVSLENGKKVDKKIVQDTHKVLYETAVVFPPENVRKVSQAKDFTLTAGNYSYPFSFTIPLNNSCSKILGVTNMILFNKKSFDVVLNNNKLNDDSLYHSTNQLPPSFTKDNDTASVKYFVKVTGARSSVFKVNLRAFDPFVFLPLDLIDTNHRGEEYREVYVRKQITFASRLPEIVGVYVPEPKKKTKKGFFSSVVNSTSNYVTNAASVYRDGYYQIQPQNVSFSFEIRFQYHPYLVPSKAPAFQLFLISTFNPDRYTLKQYGKPDESNGLGVIYLQSLKAELISTTAVSVKVKTNSKQELRTVDKEEVHQLCNNAFDNLRFDLRDCKRLPNDHNISTAPNTPLDVADGHMYELEIPAAYFSNCSMPNHIAPTFRTCNISRRYKMRIEGSFSSKLINGASPNTSQEVKVADLFVENITVLSGLNMTKQLAANSGLYKDSPTLAPVAPVRPPSDVKVDPEQKSEQKPDQPLPTYDDAVREGDFQDSSEHQRARRRYKNNR